MGRASRSKLQAAPALLKLDLGCGQNKREGFSGVDVAAVEGVDVVHDLLTFPWPFKPASVGEAHCSHFFEHIPGPLRGKWMDELYRVLVPNAQVTIIVPYYSSMRAAQDFTHAWPPVAESSFLYFNRQWRELNKLTHGAYALVCDFDFTYGYAVNNVWATKHEDARTHGVAHYLNVVDDLHVVLTKRATTP